MRIWHGVTAAAKSDEYLDYRTTEGNLGVCVLRRIEDERFLLDFEPTVEHYDVLTKPRSLPDPEA